MFLYFVEGHAVADEKPPTPEDVTAAVKGEMQIFKVDQDQVEYVGPDGLWFKARKGVLKPDGKHHFA